MSNKILQGICIGALAGAAAEMMMAACESCTGTRAGNTMRAMGSAVDDMADHLSHTFR